MRYPLGSPTSAINQTVPAAAVKVLYVLLIRTQPNNVNHNAQLSLQQQTADYSNIGSLSLRIFSFMMESGLTMNPDYPRHYMIRFLGRFVSRFEQRDWLVTIP